MVDPDVTAAAAHQRDRELLAIGREELLAVYFPHSYNFSGELVLVPAANVTYLDLPSSEVMKFIVSGGVSRLM